MMNQVYLKNLLLQVQKNDLLSFLYFSLQEGKREKKKRGRKKRKKEKQRNGVKEKRKKEKKRGKKKKKRAKEAKSSTNVHSSHRIKTEGTCSFLSDNNPSYPASH